MKRTEVNNEGVEVGDKLGKIWGGERVERIN